MSKIFCGICTIKETDKVAAHDALIVNLFCALLLFMEQMRTSSGSWTCLNTIWAAYY